MLVDLLPESAEARGLLALMLLHDSRRETRLDAAGDLVLLDGQDRARWDRAEIDEGLGRLDEALALRHPGPYQIQAAISAVHAQAVQPSQTDWPQIRQLYQALNTFTPTPVVQVGWAVAIGMADGPREGLRRLAVLSDSLDSYYPYHAARADLLRRQGEREAAGEAYQRAVALCGNGPERAYLQKRLEEMLIA